MKRLSKVTLSFMVACALVGIPLVFTKVHAQTSLSKWDPHFVLTFKSHEYYVSTSQVSPVGQYVGGITYHGPHSSFFRLYAIPGIPNDEAIAVQTRDGYLLAVEKH
jgi:hypothetical protein